MKPAPDTGYPPPAEFPEPDRRPPGPTNWRTALLSLVAARVALIELEAKNAARLGVTRIACWVALVICLFFMWALLLVAAIAAITAASDCRWWLVTLAGSALHLVAAILLARSVRAAAPPMFPVTRAEFHRDRQWIENLQQSPKSSD